MLIFVFLKNLYLERIFLLCIFTPIFLLYPVAEVEALGRKEIFLYIYFLSFLFLINPDSKYKKYSNIYIVFITPIVCLIYEQIIHFFPFIVASLVFQRQVKNLKSFFKICLLFVPSILIITYFFIFPLSNENHLIMEKSLLDNFNEVCSNFFLYLAIWDKTCEC